MKQNKRRETTNKRDKRKQPTGLATPEMPLLGCEERSRSIHAHKELSLLKWQEKATKLALDDTSGKMDELQGNVATLEENLKAENNDMRKCKEEFKEFERQDVKYREDFKNVNQKIRKLEDKIEKDSLKIEALVKEGEESTDLILKLEDNIPKLQKLLLDEEKLLEEITWSSKGRRNISNETNSCTHLAWTILFLSWSGELER
ncbi:hypothetical protein Fmac_014345 [Flemingia macrophylla]|uniref:Uncharacterized protein n=1 Tax=Flemingia macrophylla TaxID=520843 RepID=A0ABD1MBG0_9FABA